MIASVARCSLTAATIVVQEEPDGVNEPMRLTFVVMQSRDRKFAVAIASDPGVEPVFVRIQPEVEET